jgi:RNA polymerase sigma factor (sigma-70 family)
MHEALVQDCLKQKRGSEEALFKSCFSFLWTTCRTYSVDDQEAMGYLNFGFYKILIGLNKRKDHVPFKNWAKRVVINAIIDEKRKHNKYNNQVIYPENGILSNGTTIEMNVFQENDCEYIIGMIRNLPPTTSMVFSLFAIDGFAYEEIAQKLSISESTVRWHISEARKKLFVKLSKLNTAEHGKAG